MAKSKQIDDAVANASKNSTMEKVIDALTHLDEKRGVSYQRIKKFIEAKYHVDMDRYSNYVKKALLKGVTDGKFKKTTGLATHGINGKLKTQI